jgi:hypothetical protein
MLSVSAGTPAPWSPLPLAVIVPIMAVVDRLHRLAFLLGYLTPAAAFVLFSLPLLRGADRIPFYARRTAFVLVVLNLAELAMSVSPGLQYQGGVQVAAMLVLNAAFVAGLVAVSLRNERVPSFASNLAFHALLFAWLGWCAFPWLGELI